MQIQKEEIKNDILKIAEYEFLMKGYNKSSLRTIAKKAKTSLGNLYNYFPNKEALLDNVIGDVEVILKQFVSHTSLNNDNNDEVENFLKPFILYEQDFSSLDLIELIKTLNVQQMSEFFTEMIHKLVNVDVLVSNKTIILMEGCKGTKYEKARDDIYKIFHNHLSEHLNVLNNDMFVDTFVTSLFAGILYAAKNKKSLEDGRYIITKYLTCIFIGLVFGNVKFNIFA